MRCPSAYCATSSGMPICKRRVNTQPDSPAWVRTRLQSSVGIGFAGVWLPAAGGTSWGWGWVLERSSQSAVSGGGFGKGGGGYFGSLGGFRALVLAFLGAGGISGFV